MRLYVAAPLFTEAERAFNLVLARALEAAGYDVYLPQRDTPETEAADRVSQYLLCKPRGTEELGRGGGRL